jgi:hypothetical protein
MLLINAVALKVNEQKSQAALSIHVEKWIFIGRASL